MKKLKICIICPTNNFRADNIAAIFTQSPYECEVYYSEKGECTIWKDDWEKTNIPEIIDLFFYHSTDDFNRHYPERVKFKKLAIFSGGGNPELKKDLAKKIENYLVNPEDSNYLYKIEDEFSDEFPLNAIEIDNLISWVIGEREEDPSIDLYLENSIRLLEKFLPLYISLESKQDYKDEINKLKEDPEIPLFIDKIKTDKRWEKACPTFDKIKELLSSTPIITETFTDYYVKLRDELLPKPEEVVK